jgi:hypothetical protein
MAEMKLRDIKYFQSKYVKLAGSNYDEVYARARQIYDQIKAKSKRQPYIRSAYFGTKIFLELFWIHNAQKHRGERLRRLRYYQCALDLLQHSRFAPVEKRNPNGNHERVFRFYGKTKSGEEFWVQVKEDKKTKGKYMMSIVPPKQKNG